MRNFVQVAGQQEQKEIKGNGHHQKKHKNPQSGKKYLQITYLIMNFMYI